MRQSFWRIFCGAYFSGAYCVPGACCSLTVHPLKLSEVRLERSPILSGNDLRREKLMVSEHSVLIFPIHNGSEERFPRIERSFSSLNSCISSGTSNCCGCGEVKGDGGGYWWIMSCSIFFFLADLISENTSGVISVRGTLMKTTSDRCSRYNFSNFDLQIFHFQNFFRNRRKIITASQIK